MTPWTPEGSPLPPSPRPRVLLIDDDEAVLSVLAEYLQAAGYPVATATNARDTTMLLAEGEPYDVVVLDWSLPDIPARDLMRLLREMLPDAALIVTTGHGPDTVHNDLSTLGIHSVLRKPYSMRLVRRAVEAAWADRAPSAETLSSLTLDGG